MQQVGSRLLNWLRNCSSASDENIEARRFVNLISIIDDPDSYPPPSKQYSLYSNEVTRIMAELGTEPKARAFLLDTYILSKAGSVPEVAVYYPPLREYVKRYRKTPELLVTLYDFCGALLPEQEGAGEWLKEAHEMESQNEFVLWQRFLSRGNPWFPKQMIHSHDPLEDEKWLLDELLKQNPHDPLALGVQSYLAKTQRPLLSEKAVKDDIEFLNSLRRVAPHPWRNMGLVTMLRNANDPRTIKRRFPQLAEKWFVDSQPRESTKGGIADSDVDLRLSGKRVTRCYVDYNMFSLEFWKRHERTVVRIGGSMELETTGISLRLSPREPREAGQACLLLDKTVQNAFGHRDGSLDLSFTDGSHLIVPSDSKYGGWAASADDGFFAESLSGGRLWYHTG